MKLLWYICYFLGLAHASPQILPIIGSGRIVGGENANIEDIPYQVSVRFYGSHHCGGSILSKTVILTAGHCIIDPRNAESYSIQYGVTQIGGMKNVIKADRLLRHELYNEPAIDYDLALVFLKESIVLSPLAQIISLPNNPPTADVECVTSGWGVMKEGNWELASTLQKVTVNVVDRDKCASQYMPYTITDHMLCAGVVDGGRDACQGDSGGPLVTKSLEIIGVVSWGAGCARPAYPGVYTDVYSLRDWIEFHTNSQI